MQWDLGFTGLALLAGMSLGFGLIAQFVASTRTTRWIWAVSAAAYFLAGLLTSEVWFGWATQEDLQPNIDGLSFDEVLLFGTLAGTAAVLGWWLVARRRRRPAAGGRSGTGLSPRSAQGR